MPYTFKVNKNNNTESLNYGIYSFSIYDMSGKIVFEDSTFSLDRVKSILAEYDIEYKGVNPAYFLTCEEWKTLPNEDKEKYSQDESGAMPYHSNYHLCSVMTALKNKFPVSKRVMMSFDEFTRITVLHYLTGEI